ncbi:MAG: rubredoxin [Oscillospiraceae bacterium]
MKKYVCTICGYVYDESKEKLKWDELPDDWKCPLCGASKTDFAEEVVVTKTQTVAESTHADHQMKELNNGELSALCSNLAKGCEKQYMLEQSELFTQLADYYKVNTSDVAQEGFQKLLDMINSDLENEFKNANIAANASGDRGAKRALTWSEKVTRMLNSLLLRIEKDGDEFIKNTNVYVCDICGFVYVGEQPPDICPICKVPSLKILKIERS